MRSLLRLQAIRLELAVALLLRRRALIAKAHRARGSSLRARRCCARKLRWLEPHRRKAAALCFKEAERLRTDASSAADLRLAKLLYRTALVSGGRSIQAQARAKYILMLCQQQRPPAQRSGVQGLSLGPQGVKLRHHLINGGFQCKLARGVLRYPREMPSAATEALAALQPGPGVSCALDGALPAEMLAKLQAAFAPDSPFWAEHAYTCGVSPFFSYVHSLEGPPRTGFDRVLRFLQGRAEACGFFASRQARYAEWWAHCRPHGVGHQVHFDSDDEGIGGIRNPIVSSALYLTGGGVGGPTLVTDQRRVGAGSGLARRGWLVLPKENRYLLFDGRLLHGVVPGRGVAGGGDGECTHGLWREEPARRVTLMVAFWPHIRQRESARPGAARPFPYEHVAPGASSSVSWPSLFDWPTKEDGRPAEAPEPTQTPMRPIQPVWEPVDGEKMPDGMPEYDECFQGF